jgi:hypothetical protein
MNTKILKLKTKLKAARLELQIHTRTRNLADRAYNKVTAKIASLEKELNAYYVA